MGHNLMYAESLGRHAAFYADGAAWHGLGIVVEGARSWDETMERIAAGWEMHEMQIEASGWSYDSRKRVWYCSH